MQPKQIALSAIIMGALSCASILLVINRNPSAPKASDANNSTESIADDPKTPALPAPAERTEQAPTDTHLSSVREPQTDTDNATYDPPPLPESDLSQDLSAPKQRGRLFVIIDDVGYSLHDLSQFLKLDIPLTFAILPNLEHSLAAAELISQHGHQYILHLPMEPLDTSLTDPQAILISDSDQVIRDKIIAMTASLPNIQGVNNHMGSRATSDGRIMRILFEQLKAQELFFVNSLTSVDTIRHEMADEIGLTYLERHLFLDHVAHPQAIAVALAKGSAQAHSTGEAVLIGHVGVAATAAVLAKYADSSEAQQIAFDYIVNHDNFRN